MLFFSDGMRSVLTSAVTVLASGATSTISQTDLVPGANWIGTSILGGVLGWLLFRHLPEKDRQTEKLIQTKDAAVQAVVTAFCDERKSEREAFLAELHREREDCRSPSHRTRSPPLRRSALRFARPGPAGWRSMTLPASS